MQNDQADTTRRWFIWIYLFIGILVVISREVHHYWLHYSSKPLIMLSLLLLYLQQSHQDRTSKEFWFVIGAICASCLGDICLMFEGNVWFLAGLSSFLCAHVAYILRFTNQANPSDALSILRQKPWLLLPLMLYAGLLLWLVLPEADDVMRNPVLVYATVIFLMVLSAINRYGRVPTSSFREVSLGAILFMLSDSMIAIHRFAEEILPIPGVQFWIIFTYMSAQYLIITGLLKEE